MLDPALEEIVENTPKHEEVEIIARLTDPKKPPTGIRIISKFGDIITGRVYSDQILEIRKQVKTMKASRLVNWEPPEETDTVNETFDFVSFENNDYRIPRQITGKNTVVAALDWGIDFASPAFRRNDGTTRLLAIWDQSVSMSNNKPNTYGYGQIYLREEINKALQENNPYSTLNYHPSKGDPLRTGAHGTHVLDIAAGSKREINKIKIQGVAPDADLIFVHLGAQKIGGISNLGDSVRILEALDFVNHTAGEMPWVANLSVGSHGGPHDGTTPVERGMDNLISESPGRAICMSTGNYKRSRVHTHGRLRPGGKRVFTWIVDSADITPNELEVWYSGKDVFTVNIQSPNGFEFSANLGEKTSMLIDNRQIGKIYHRKNEPNNHDNHMDIFLYQDAPSGRWKVTLQEKTVINGNYHVWIERDRGSSRNQSRLSKKDVTLDYTTGSICNGTKTIAVGAFDSINQNELAPFSSCGETRDGRQKPDCLAPGVQILAARSTPKYSKIPISGIVEKSGTSMAAPHVTGTLSLVFEAASKKLNISETQKILLGSTEKISTNSSCYGDGYLDIDKVLEKTLNIEKNEEHDTKLASSHESYMSSIHSNSVMSESDESISKIPDNLDNTYDNTIDDNTYDNTIDEIDTLMESLSHIKERLNKIRFFTEKNPALETENLSEDANWQRWFNRSSRMPQVRSDNKVTELIDGRETFRSMVNTISAATSRGDFIYMLNWDVNVNFPLITGRSSTRLRDLLTTASNNNVQIRAMLWRPDPFYSRTQNVGAVRFINSLSNGGAIRDGNHITTISIPLVRANIGAHHQKILVVKTENNLIGFCGGIDFVQNRITQITSSGSGSGSGSGTAGTGQPLHDVHCKIEGPAAYDLLQIFNQRWIDHPRSRAIDTRKGSLLGRRISVPPPMGNQFVQICRTYGNGRSHNGIRSATGNRFYSFARNGERTIIQMVIKAIREAQNFIYIEEQYLLHIGIARELARKVRQNVKLIILIPHSRLSEELKTPWSRRKRFIDTVLGSSSGTNPNVAICFLKQSGVRAHPVRGPARGSRHTYVHSKIMIMDDLFAIIGTANINNRGYTHDSEVSAGIYGPSPTNSGTSFAKQLRLKLWAEHLNLTSSSSIDNPIRGFRLWSRPSISSRIALYDRNASNDSFISRNHPANAIIDPDGS